MRHYRKVGCIEQLIYIIKFIFERRRKMKKLSLVGIVQVSFIAIILISYILLMAKYGNTPMSEVPVWVWWLLHGGN